MRLLRPVSKLLLKASGGLRRAADLLDTPELERRNLPWRAANGDRTHRLDYDLKADSLVFDLGGYEGQWASDIVARYCCRVFVFEPVPEFAEAIRRRFARNPCVRVFEFGLSDRDAESAIALDCDASSQFRGSGRRVPIRLVRAADFLRDQDIRRIDLMKVNIEGGEYDLLDHLIDCGAVSGIRDLQVQFHDFVPDAAGRRESILKRLAHTHAPTYQYPFVWENWRRVSEA